MKGISKKMMALTLAGILAFGGLYSGSKAVKLYAAEAEESGEPAAEPTGGGESVPAAAPTEPAAPAVTAPTEPTPTPEVPTDPVIIPDVSVVIPAISEGSTDPASMISVSPEGTTTTAVPENATPTTTTGDETSGSEEKPTTSETASEPTSETTPGTNQEDGATEGEQTGNQAEASVSSSDPEQSDGTASSTDSTSSSDAPAGTTDATVTTSTTETTPTAATNTTETTPAGGTIASINSENWSLTDTGFSPVSATAENVTNTGTLVFKYQSQQDEESMKIVRKLESTGSFTSTSRYAFDISYVNEAGEKVSMGENGKVTITFRLPSKMDTSKGIIRVLSMDGEALQQHKATITTAEDGTQYVTFTTGHFSDYAVLYTRTTTPVVTPSSGSGSSSGSSRSSGSASYAAAASSPASASQTAASPASAASQAVPSTGVAMNPVNLGNQPTYSAVSAAANNGRKLDNVPKTGEY